MRQYKIAILTLQNTPLTFIVDEYKIVEGDFVSFSDPKTSIPKKFHASRCEISEIDRRSSDGRY